MQDRYVCDIGDFAKYSLLNALSGTDLQLGVIWCRNTVEEKSSDGRFTKYPELRECNERVYDTLGSLLREGQRNLAAIERSGILPAGTRFFSEPLPAGIRRVEWIQNAGRAVEGADLIFLDPDNGLPESAAAWRRDSRKYASLQELVGLRSEHRSVVLYQHQTRSGSFEEQLERHCTAIRALGVDDVWALSFHRRSVRGFLVVPARGHAPQLKERCRHFIQSQWGREGHFKFRVHHPGVGNETSTPLKAKAAGTTLNNRASNNRTTDPGYSNRNGQTVIGPTGLAGTDHGQRVYVLQCGWCLREYGANGSDIFQRRCPWCQSGRPGLPTRQARLPQAATSTSSA